MVIKYYVAVSNEGDIQGFYCTDIHDEIPTNVVEITEAQWSGALAIEANKYVAGEFVKHDAVLTTEETYANNLVFRKTAYKEESDHLFLEWQFDRTSSSEQAWLDKVKEIKERYPLK